MTYALTSGSGSKAFPPTRWSVVLAATDQPSPESDAALDSLCRAYWHPLYAYVRRCGHSPHDAQDLTQEFFRLLLEKRWLNTADQRKGRLRSFLLTALKHFMAKEWRRESAAKRAGGKVHVPIDTRFAESRFAAAPDAQLGAEALFDHQWALTLLDLTVERLQAEFAAAGKAEEFSALKPCLAARHGAIDYALMAARLGVSEGAARVAAHRLRKRFRQVYREEIAQTLSTDADLDGELRYLAGALAQT